VSEFTIRDCDVTLAEDGTIWIEPAKRTLANGTVDDPSPCCVTIERCSFTFAGLGENECFLEVQEGRHELHKGRIRIAERA